MRILVGPAGLEADFDQSRPLELFPEPHPGDGELTLGTGMRASHRSPEPVSPVGNETALDAAVLDLPVRHGEIRAVDGVQSKELLELALGGASSGVDDEPGSLAVDAVYDVESS